MGILDRLFARRAAEPVPSSAADLQAICAHITLIGHWDVETVDEAEEFSCSACAARFTPEEGYRLLRTSASFLSGSTAAPKRARRSRRWPSGRYDQARDRRSSGRGQRADA